MNWTQGTVYGFDCESTGVDVHTDRIVTATVVKIVGGEHVDQRSWLIDPGIEIPEGATKVHGITTEHARANGVHPTEALGQIAGTVAAVLRAGLPLAVFNAAYDISLLEAELRRHDQGGLMARVGDQWNTLIDPFVLGRGLDMVNRQFVKGRKYTLVDMCGRWRVPFTESHDATADAVGAGLLAIALFDAEPYFADMGPGALSTLQRTWHRSKQDSFRDWVVKNGHTEKYGDIDSGWPFHTALTQAVSA